MVQAPVKTVRCSKDFPFMMSSEESGTCRESILADLSLLHCDEVISFIFLGGEMMLKITVISPPGHQSFQ